MFCNQVLQFDPKNDRAWFNKGNAYDTEGKIKKAMYCYDKAIVLNPKNVDALYNKAALLHDKHKLKDAIELFDIILSIDPKHKEAEIAKTSCQNEIMGKKGGFRKIQRAPAS